MAGDWQPPFPPHLRVPRRLWSLTKREATKRGIPFELTFDELIELMERAQGRCEISFIPFSDERWGSYRKPWAMSIDRIDSREGYRKDNVRLVCVAVNFAMQDWGEDVLILIVQSMLEHALDQIRQSRAVGAGRGPEVP